MNETFEQKLLNAIRKDDLKAFKAMMEETNLGNLRMGRFPVLSLLYLYDSRKILSAYEEAFLRVSTWTPIGEPACLSRLFSKKAGKCLRLYFDETVSPVEMLLILDKTRQVKKAYPIAKPSEAIRKRLKTIYSIKYALGVTYKGNDIVLDRRPLSRREKRRLALACIGCLLIVAIIIATPVTLTALLPNRAAGEVARLRHIDFSSRETYTVVRDIVIPDGYTVDVVNCTLKGGGGKLIFGKGATLGRFSGTLSDIEIQTAGSPIFDVCTNLATLSNVTVNVDANLETSEDTAFVARTNYGTFDGVKVNVRGSLRAVASDDSAEGEGNGIYVGGMVADNIPAGLGLSRVYGMIKNCTVNYDDFKLSGELEANASFGGIAGANYAKIEDCKVTGKISADKFDVAGACYANVYTMTRVSNEAEISQISDADGWTPIVGGLIIENAGTAEYCKNSGALSARSVGDAMCGGISAHSYGEITYCYSEADIRVWGKTAYAGGIFGRSDVAVDTYGNIYVGVADHCLSRCSIYADVGDGVALVGGIGGYLMEDSFSAYVYDENGTVIKDENGEALVTEVYRGGSVTNCVFEGAPDGAAEYFGSILGGVGAEVYENNALTLSGEGHNLLGNLYAENGSHAVHFTVHTAEIDGKEELAVSVVDGDTGARSHSATALKNNALYKDILDHLGM